ncbi:uncharacterized protein TNCV_20031 [Trichonephila clavipes]|nr:uncharacterized protein TNCV_20031 [Trichonephila clavipes]
MITGKEHSSGPVVVLPFFWVPPPANVGREASFWKLVLQTLLKFILFISPVMLLNSNGRVNWDNVRFAIKPPVIVGLPCKSTMDQVDAFPEHISTTVIPVTLPEKPDALVYAAQQGHVRACIIYQEPNAKRVFVLFCKDHWYQKKTLLDNFKRAILEAKHLNEFRPDDVLWEKISKGLLRNPDRFLKNTDKRMVYIYNNMFFVKKDFTFGFRTVKSGEIHLIQTTHVPMLIYELPASSLKCRAQPNVIRRSFEPHDQMLYHRTILEPHTAYPIPAGTHYTSVSQTKRYYYKKLQVLPKLEKYITDLDAQEKRNEEKVIDDFISIMDSLIKEFSARFSQFKELSETFEFIMYPDVISFDKLNLSQFDWLEIEELEMQLIDFQSSSIWIQKFIETKEKVGID